MKMDKEKYIGLYMIIIFTKMVYLVKKMVVRLNTENIDHI